MTNTVTQEQLFAPHFADMPEVKFAKATSIVSATTDTGATVVSTTVFDGGEAGVRGQSTWNDHGFSSVVGHTLDQVVSDLTQSVQRAIELAPSLENK